MERRRAHARLTGSAGDRAAECASGVNGGEAARVPNTTNLWFDSLDGEALVIALDLKGLAVSSGAACSSGANEPSHVLEAMGLSETGHAAACALACTGGRAKKRLIGQLSWSLRRWRGLRELSAVTR